MRNCFKMMLLSILFLCLAAPVIAADQISKVGAQSLQAPLLLKNIELAPGKIALQQTERQQLNTATHQLINQNFGSRLNSSSSIQSLVNVVGRTGNKLNAEALIVFRAKNTYTANISKLQYEVEGSTAILKNKIDNYVPMQTIVAPTSLNPELIQQKAALIKDLKIILPGLLGPKALANTSAPEFPTAVTGTNNVSAIFRQAFGDAYTSTKIGNTSTKTAILDILKNSPNLLAWNNIGHGNPSSIVQWDSPIFAGDFSSTINFKGLYKAVVLINSCNVCASPYSLRNAIWQHQPRTYIGGMVSLPVGPSESVDVAFWNKTLLQNKLMAVALSEASALYGQSGKFCLNGYNGTFIASK